VSRIRDNWRVIALVFLLTASGLALFSPAGAIGATEGAEGPTNLKFGIELSGGSRIRAPVAGMTADGVELTSEDQIEQVERTVEQELALDPVDVRVSNVRGGQTGQAGQAGQANGTVEVFADPIAYSEFDPDRVSREQFQEYVNASENVSAAEFASALRAAGLDLDEGDVRRGVSQATIESIQNVIQNKINAAGLSGGSVRIAQSATGERFIVVESPGRSIAELEELISRRGTVQVLAFHPDADGGDYTNTTIMTQDMSYSIGPPNQDQRGGEWSVSVTFEDDEDARRFVDRMQAADFDEGVDCRAQTTQAIVERGERCLLTVFDDEVVSTVGVTPSFGRSLSGSASGFLDSPQFVITVPNQSEARDIQIALKAGRLPASLDMSERTSFEVEPALAEEFKLNSLITGILAVLAVAGVVYIRYGDARIAAPMVVTALSEVVLLLGFAAAIGYPLDLSVIAGFIAVIGTGVDDLIIIADEVMAEGDVNSSRVFQSRFRKAFWVIGAAAATTILAMSPLAVLSLGDLQGFAIVTIMGVLVGVLITRPAYGDILRRLTTN
jgi:preprotein translocase subunit SecD